MPENLSLPHVKAGTFRLQHHFNLNVALLARTNLGCFRPTLPFQSFWLHKPPGPARLLFELALRPTFSLRTSIWLSSTLTLKPETCLYPRPLLPYALFYLTLSSTLRLLLLYGLLYLMPSSILRPLLPNARFRSMCSFTLIGTPCIGPRGFPCGA